MEGIFQYFSPSLGFLSKTVVTVSSEQPSDGAEIIITWSIKQYFMAMHTKKIPERLEWRALSYD
jgi:hypothetical protein